MESNEDVKRERLDSYILNCKRMMYDEERRISRNG